MLNDVQTIKFDSKYVSGKAKELITNFERNTYIIKGSTGIGGTTALLNYTQGNCLIISPNVGMIKGKEGKHYDSDLQLFIYGGSKDKWKYVTEYLDTTESQNLIINTTPDQICKLRENNIELYNQIREFNVFVDEFHVYTSDATYRDSVGQLMEYLFNEWVGKFKLSTATPNYNFIDIPNDVEIDTYRIERENQPKKQLYYTTDKENIKLFVYDEVSKGNKVVMFTNNSRLHKSFTDLRVHNLTGETLKIKLAPFDRGQQGINIPNDAQLIICSSSYYAGFDIDFDCSMIFVSEQQHQANKINLNNLQQAYGRCRASVINGLFVNQTTISQKEITLNNVNTAISQAKQSIFKAENELKKDTEYCVMPKYVNRSEINAIALDIANDYLLYNSFVMLDELKANNFVITKYDNDFDIVIEKTSTDFKDRIKNLMLLDEKQLYYGYLGIKKQLTYKNNPKFTTALALEYLSAFLLKKSLSHLISMLDNKRLKANELYSSMDLFLRVNHSTIYLSKQLTDNQQREAIRIHQQDEYANRLNECWYLIKDWHLLYAVHKLKKGILTNEIKRGVIVGNWFHDVNIYNTNYKDTKNRIRNTTTYIINKIKDNDIELTEKEIDKLDELIKEKFIQKDKGETLINLNTKQHVVTKMVNAILFIWSEGKNEEILHSKDREFHSITQLGGLYRSIIPIKWLSADLTSANPQIVDNILNSNVGLQVYKNLMKKYNISRNKAKTLYNRCLNNHYNSVSKAYNFYLDCGYTIQQAKELSKLTAQVTKGSFYEVMTANEKELMNNYASVLPMQSHRFHDAILVEYEQIVKHNVILPTNVNDYVYHVNFFNDESDYDNVTDEKRYTENGYISNSVVTKK